jgi:hypothetical protein
LFIFVIISFFSAGVRCSNAYMVHIASSDNFMDTLEYGLQVPAVSISTWEQKSVRF